MFDIDGETPPSEHHETVSLETTRRHYGVWRWRVELESSRRFVTTWSKISSSQLDPGCQVRLANVAWALAGFERSYDLLAEDFHRADQARQHGLPAVMLFLSGPYRGSLDYLIGASLWLDLGELVTHYRTVVDRFRLLTGPARRHRLPADVATVEMELEQLMARSLPALGSDPIIRLAGRVLHEAWHPAGSADLAFPLYFRNTGAVDLAEADLRGQLRDLTEETLGKVTRFLLAQAS